MLNWAFSSAIAALVTTFESSPEVGTFTVVAPVLVCVGDIGVVGVDDESKYDVGESAGKCGSSCW